MEAVADEQGNRSLTATESVSYNVRSCNYENSLLQVTSARELFFMIYAFMYDERILLFEKKVFCSLDIQFFVLLRN